jgi:hypothetical protein
MGLVNCELSYNWASALRLQTACHCRPEINKMTYEIYDMLIVEMRDWRSALYVKIKT